MYVTFAIALLAGAAHLAWMLFAPRPAKPTQSPRPVSNSAMQTYGDSSFRWDDPRYWN